MGKVVPIYREGSAGMLEVSVQTTDLQAVHLHVWASGQRVTAPLTATEARAVAAVLLERADWADFSELRGYDASAGDDENPPDRCRRCAQPVTAAPNGCTAHPTLPK